MKADLMDLAIMQDDSDNEGDFYSKRVIDDKDLKHILKLRPERRLKDQIEIIKNHVKDIKVFKEFNQKTNEDQLNELCRNLNLQFLPENKVLFEQGDRGDSYFIILDGSVDILIRVVDDKNGLEYKKKVAILKKGDAFGDLSLLYGAPRNATVQTREDSYFIVMSKATYDKVIKTHQVGKIHEIAQFYLNFPLFQHLDKITLMYFATKTVAQKLQSKQMVVKQGDDPGRVYFVKSGRLRVIRKVYFRKLPNNGYLRFDELIDEPLTTEIRNGLFEMRLLQLDVLEQGDVFCHNSVIMHKPIEYSVVTEVPCEAFIINEMDFLTLNKQTLDEFQEYIKAYPSDRELRKMHYETIRWKNYKQNLMESIRLNKQIKTSFSSLLRGGQAQIPKVLDQEYLNMHDDTIVYHKNFKSHQRNADKYKLKQSLQKYKEQNEGTVIRSNKVQFQMNQESGRGDQSTQRDVFTQSLVDSSIATVSSNKGKPTERDKIFLPPLTSRAVKKSMSVQRL